MTSKLKNELLNVAFENKNNEMAALNLLGSDETLAILAEAQQQNKTAVFYYDEDGSQAPQLDRLLHKFI